MLTKIRERASGWIAWVIVTLITIPFALWGISSYLEGANELDVAVVNGDEIGFQEYQDSLARRQQNLQRMLGANFDSEYYGSVEFRRTVVDQLVNDRLVSQDLSVRGYRISDERLSKNILAIPQFQSEGEFDRELYQRTLQGSRMTVAQFENSQRQTQALGQLRNSVTDSGFLFPQERANLSMLGRQKRLGEFIFIDTLSLETSVEIDDEQVREYFQQHRDKYTAPAQVRIEYIELNVGNLSESSDPTQQELNELYEENRDRYQVTEQRSASHILLKLPKQEDTETGESVRKLAAEIVNRARGGEDFAVLASENSEDIGSAGRGGDLGVITPGAMVKPFEDAVYQLELDEVSDPVESRFGLHIIKLTDLVPGAIKPIEEVEDELRKELMDQYAEEQFYELSEDFRNLVFETPDSLQPVADELDMVVKVSDWFSEDSGDGIAENTRIRRTAFSEEVKDQGQNSNAIENGLNSLVSLRVIESRDQRSLEFDEAKEVVIADFRKLRALENAVEQGESLLAELDKGGDWHQLIETRGLSAQAIPETRNAGVTEIENTVSERVFSLPRPAEGDPVYEGIALMSDGFAVVRLDSVVDPDPDEENEQDSESSENLGQVLNQQLENRWNRELYRSYIESLRNDASIRVLEENL